MKKAKAIVTDLINRCNAGLVICEKTIKESNADNLPLATSYAEGAKMALITILTYLEKL